MALHPVERALQRDVLPYLVTARRLRRRWFYIVSIVFAYVTDLAIAATTLGVSSPLVRFLAKSAAQEQQSQQSVAPLSELISGIPNVLYVPMVVLLVAWIVLRVAFN